MRVTVGWNESLFTLLDSLIPIRRRERKGVKCECEQWMQGEGGLE
jgi:hypothetical protein